MGALDHVREWRACLRADVLADLHGHQVHALADLSFAMAAVGHCHSGRVAAAVAGRARAASSCRRLERTLANPRLRPSRVFAGLARFAADRLAGRPILLILDETHNGRRLACMKLSIAYRKRALPIAAACYRRDRPPRRMPRLIERLLRRAARGLPAGADVTLLTDRGLTWPAVLDACRALGWHFVGRVKGTTRLLRGDGSWHALSELVPRPGGRWSGRGRAFKKAGGRDLHVAAVWEHGCREPWLLVSDRARRLSGRADLRQAVLDRGAVPGREEPGPAVAAQPRDRPGPRHAAGGPDGPGDAPGREPGDVGAEVGPRRRLESGRAAR